MLFLQFVKLKKNNIGIEHVFFGNFVIMISNYVHFFVFGTNYLWNSHDVYMLLTK